MYLLMALGLWCLVVGWPVPRKGGLLLLALMALGIIDSDILNAGLLALVVGVIAFYKGFLGFPRTVRGLWRR